MLWMMVMTLYSTIMEIMISTERERLHNLLEAPENKNGNKLRMDWDATEFLKRGGSRYAVLKSH
jgi:hypothetical protein